MLKIFQLPETSKIYCALKKLLKAASFHIVVDIQIAYDHSHPATQACQSHQRQVQTRAGGRGSDREEKISSCAAQGVQVLSHSG